MQADIYSMKNFGVTDHLGTVTLENGKAVLSDGVQFLNHNPDDPILDKDRNPVTLDDGERFISALPYRFHNPYLWAEVS